MSSNTSANHRRYVFGPAFADQRIQGESACLYDVPTGLEGHTEMIDQFTNLEHDDSLLPTASLDLSASMRELRARLRLKQREVARRIGLDPSILGLWERGQRSVPANRVRSLAQALEVTVEELLGLTRAPQPARQIVEGVARGVLAEPDDKHRLHQLRDQPLLRLLPQLEGEVIEPPVEESATPWVIPERPALRGWIPDGWEPSDRVQDISPALPDGYWVDPVRLERVSVRQVLRARLCLDDQQLIGDRDVPGAALAERIYRHCSKLDSFLHFRNAAPLPLIETIFRAVLAAEYGGLTDDALIEALCARSSGRPVNTALLRRLRHSVRPYPIRRVDADLFGGRR
jgi:transcriptional regulator with XRE-family HTH domain